VQGAGERAALRRFRREACLRRRAGRRRGAGVGVAEPRGGEGAPREEVALDPFDQGLDAPFLVRRAGVAGLRAEAALPGELQERRWFCDNSDCERYIFAERLPTIALPHAQKTQRLATIVLVFGVAVGGATGARLLGDRGIAVRGDTRRRAVAHAALPAAGTPRILGVEDWSRRKGRTYGTILVDRPAARLEIWLRTHSR